MKTVSDVQMAEIVDRLVKLTKPFYTNFRSHINNFPIDFAIFAISDQEMHRSVTELDEETGQEKRTRTARYFDIWVWSSDGEHYTRVYVAELMLDSDNDQFTQVYVGYNAQNQEAIKLRITLNTDGFWLFTAASGSILDLRVEVW